jgi:hypothetical protein
MNFDFGNVLTRAWQIIWKHKILWIFGIFAGCSRGGDGGGDGNRYNPNNPPSFGDGRQLEQFGQQISQWLEHNLWIIAVIIAAVLFLIVLSIFLGTIGRIGLIRGTYQAETGAASLSFGTLFKESLPYFWRVFGLSLLVGLAFLVVLLPIIVIGILTAGVGILCLLPLICILIPLAWIVATLLEQAYAAIVIDNLGIFDGLRRGWEVCISNLGAIIVMALILWIGSLVLGIIIALPIIASLLPLVFGLIAGGRNPTPFIIAGLCFVAYLPLLILLNGILTAYLQSAWALTYLRLTRPKENLPISVESNA